MTMTIYSLKAEHKLFKLHDSRSWDAEYPRIKAGSTKPLIVGSLNHDPQTWYERNPRILHFSLNLMKSYSYLDQEILFCKIKELYLIK